jgi:hypothetical protein
MQSRASPQDIEKHCGALHGGCFFHFASSANKITGNLKLIFMKKLNCLQSRFLFFFSRNGTIVFVAKLLEDQGFPISYKTLATCFL